MSDLSKKATAIAAKATGLRPDQIERALTAYRDAIPAIEDEPEWQAQMHMRGAGFAVATYAAENTSIILQYDSWTGERDDKWRQEKRYILRGKPYQTYAEARAIELEATTRPRPYAINAQGIEAEGRDATPERLGAGPESPAPPEDAP